MSQILKIRTHVKPDQVVSEDNFSFEKQGDELPPREGSGKLRLQLTHISIDPWYLGLLKPGLYSWCDPLPEGAPMMGTAVAKVVAVGSTGDEGNKSAFSEGDLVSGFFQFQDGVFEHDGQGLNSLHGAAPEAALSIFGGPAVTAFFGLEDVGKPKEGDVVVISAAAGSVGTIVAQLCKSRGCYVIGFAGSDKKCTHLKNVIKIDAAVNYKNENWQDEFKTALPEGKRVNVFWDNTAGGIADAVYPAMADHGRVVLCGEISNYSTRSNGSDTSSAAPAALPHSAINHIVLERRLRVEGILVTEFFPRMGEAMPTLLKLHQEGKLTATTHVVQGFDQTVQAFLGLFSGKNVGKTIVAL